MGIATPRGVNAAVVAKIFADWQVQAWVGKAWNGGHDYRATVMRSW